MDDDFDSRWDRDVEREPTHRTRQRIPVVLDARGTTKQRFEPCSCTSRFREFRRAVH